MVMYMSRLPSAARRVQITSTRWRDVETVDCTLSTVRQWILQPHGHLHEQPAQCCLLGPEEVYALVAM